MDCLSLLLGGRGNMFTNPSRLARMILASPLFGSKFKAFKLDYWKCRGHLAASAVPRQNCLIRRRISKAIVCCGTYRQAAKQISETNIFVIQFQILESSGFSVIGKFIFANPNGSNTAVSSERSGNDQNIYYPYNMLMIDC